MTAHKFSKVADLTLAARDASDYIEVRISDGGAPEFRHKLTALLAKNLSEYYSVRDYSVFEDNSSLHKADVLTLIPGMPTATKPSLTFGAVESTLEK